MVWVTATSIDMTDCSQLARLCSVWQACMEFTPQTVPPLSCPGSHLGTKLLSSYHTGVQFLLVLSTYSDILPYKVSTVRLGFGLNTSLQPTCHF